MRLCLLPFLLLVSLIARAEQPSPAPDWKPLDFLLGEWIAKGGGGPGQGSGNFSFHFDLEKHVMVRKNTANYAAANGRPAYHHENLMVIFPDDQAKQLVADYFDTEGHVIRYRVQRNAPSGTVIFVSEPAANSPRFRLSYKRIASGLEGTFEIAPPQKPEEFKVYLQWRAAYDH